MQDHMNLNMYSAITETILGCCFEVMNELGSGFLEAVYKQALFMAIEEKGLKIELERRFEVIFRGQRVGVYVADLIIENMIIVELKCCESLIGAHQAQLINYLKTSGLLVGLLINFGNRKLEYKRLHHPDQAFYDSKF
jgi:GxxExxY protein